jgi:uncharacterized protein (DUF1015 family)
LLRATRANLSAVYGTVSGPVQELTSLLAEVTAGEPSGAMVDEEGVSHRIWPVAADPAIAGWLEDEPLLIADGHHRYTTALRYRDERRAEDGAGAWDALLALVVDAGTEEPPVLPFHRVVGAGGAARAGEINGQRVRDLQEVLAELDDETGTIGVVRREAGGLVHLVTTLEGGPPAVSALHERVLGTGEGEDGLRFTPDPVDAESAVRSGDAGAAYLLPPTTTGRIHAVVERGDRLPQKSTFFWPKPRTGMVLRPLE